MLKLSAADILPADAARAVLIGRVWLPGPVACPTPVVVRDGKAHDLARVAPTVSALLARSDPGRFVAALRSADLPVVATVDEALAGAASGNAGRLRFLAPCDLQAVKACGVTFASSLLERVVEEQARGDWRRAESVRKAIVDTIGEDLTQVKPGSERAAKLKARLIELGCWSQYLEVGIGPDAEVFTKTTPMAAVGVGAGIGIHPASEWSNPEPEIVLAIDGRDAIVGATLGNDVNLRDFEGRSALLLGKAKDNNASAAIGPFIRLFADGFSLDDVRRAEVRLTVVGEDGFAMKGLSPMRAISRDPADLAAQASGGVRQHPDGLMLYMGTMFAPTDDRGEKGKGFTHKIGDVVTIASERLGALINRVEHCDRLPPWDFGTGALMTALARRGLLGG